MVSETNDDESKRVPDAPKPPTQTSEKEELRPLFRSRLPENGNGSGPPPKSTLARRMRLAIERTMEELARLTEASLDPLIGPTSGFAATTIAWLTTLCFFGVSLVVGAWLGVGALVLFVGLELLALLAYAYPGALFLLSVAGGVVPAVILYWAAHVLFVGDAPWTTWLPFALIAVGVWGSYYYWRFGRVISLTGENALAFYRGAAPKAKEIFGAPFGLLSFVWDVITTIFGVFRGITRELFGLMARRREAQPKTPFAPGTPPAPPRAAPPAQDNDDAPPAD